MEPVAELLDQDNISKSATETQKTACMEGVVRESKELLASLHLALEIGSFRGFVLEARQSREPSK